MQASKGYGPLRTHDTLACLLGGYMVTSSIGSLHQEPLARVPQRLLIGLAHRGVVVEVLKMQVVEADLPQARRLAVAQLAAHLRKRA